VSRFSPAKWRRTSGSPAFAFTVCFTLTLVISLATARTKSDAELKGLVYSLTPKIVDTNSRGISARPSSASCC
jgi:hypothetical protein